MNRRRRMIPISNGVLAAFATIALAGIWQNLRLFDEQRTLATELAALRGEQVSHPVSNDPSLAERVAQLTHEVTNETALLQTAEARLAEIQRAMPPVEGEELRSFGHIEELGREAADLLPIIADFSNKMQERAAGKLSEEEWARLMTKLLAWTNRLGAIGELEDDPSEIARFHAATLQARLQLDAATTEALRAECAREFARIKSAGLARSQRPESGQAEWYSHRKRALDEAAARVEVHIPVTARVAHAVGQSFHLGTGLRTSSQIGADGHGVITMGLDLPGVSVK